MRFVVGRLNLVLTLVALLLCRIASTKSAEPDTALLISPAGASWRFQRLLVPADRPEDWPRDKSQRYLPMPADEFEARLAQLRNVASPPQPQTAPLIRATYSAALLGENSLSGELTWEFEQHASRQTATLLGDCQLALDDFRWTEDAAPAESAGSQPAHVSSQNLNRDNLKAIVGNDQNGHLCAVIDRSGKMSGRWSLCGKRNSDGVLSFDLQLPACPFNLLQLTLPADLAPTIDHGMITSDHGNVSADQATTSTDHGVTSAANGSATGLRRWQIELGGNCRANLRIVKQTAIGPTPEKTFVRQSFTYDFSSHGLEFYGEFRLDVLGAPLKQIKLRVDQPLTIVRIRSGETELPLSSVTTVHTPLGNTTNSAGSADTGQGNPQELIVELAKPIQGPGQTLQIVAIAPLTWATPWQLPLMRVENADWQTGAAQLRVPDSLVIDELSTEDCRQTNLETAIDVNLAGNLGALPESSPGEAVSLAFFNDHPRIELAISRRREQVRVAQGTSISLRANEGTGRYRGEFTIDQGELFVLQADIAPQWIIESVESTPPGMVADWSQQLARNRGGKLTLQLSTPLTPQHNLRLSITGRRRSAPWGETLHADDLAMLHFPDATASRRLIHVQATEAFQLQLRGVGELTRLDPVQLTAADASLLDEKPTDLVFVDDPNARNLAVSLLGKTPQYDADIQAKVLVGDDRLTESYHFAVTPQGREVSRFDVRFSQPRATPLNWSIQGEPMATVTARRLTEGEGSATNWPGEAWEVVLPTPRSTPFVLLATRTSPLTGDMPPALASFIEAQTQRGTIQVVSVGHNLPGLRSRRLKSIPVDASAADQYATMLAAFRYDPEEDTLLTADPPLVLIPQGNSAPLPQAWIWQAELTSRYCRAGAEHTLVCQVENAGLEKIQFQSPPGAILRSAWIDGQRVAELTSAITGPWKISLPAAARFVTLALCYSDELADEGTVASHAAAWPSCDVPILSRRWVVLMPPGMALADVQIGNRHPWDPPWTKRLFGPLARSLAGAPPSALTKAQNVPTDGLQLPWKAAAQNPLIDSAAWTNYCFDGVGSADRIWIADEQSLTAWAWSLFVLAVAVRWWFGNRTLALDIGLLGTATVIALWIPAAWTQLSAALWLGLFAGQVMVWVAQRSQLQQADIAPQAVSSSTASKLVTATFVLGFFMVLAAHRLVQAEETENTAGSFNAQSSSPVRHVLVPVDRDGHPTDGLYYLPEAFYDELLRVTPAAPAPLQYLITRAIYAAHAEQDHNSESSDPLAGNWQATFEIESLADHVVVQLPLGFDGAVLVPDSIKLDGQTTAFQADEKHKRLLVELNHDGPHHLEMMLRPIVHSTGFDFAVPVVAASQIDLTATPANSLRSASTSAQGTSEEIQATWPPNGTSIGATAETNQPADSNRQPSKSNRTQQLVWLGPADRIVSILPATAELHGPAPATVFDIDELYWLRIRPDSVIINARFHLQVHAGSVQQLHVLADPRWHPILPPENNAAEHASPADAVAVAQLQPSPDNPNEFVVELARPVAGQATVDIAFQLAGDSGIGRWQPLLWQVNGASAARRWWGVTIDPELDFSSSPVAMRNSITPEKFAALWPTRVSQPQVAWQSTQPEAPWSIATRPRRPKLSASYQLAAIAGQNEMDLHWAAQVTASDGKVFQYRLQIPPEMEIDDVLVREQNVDQPCRWSRSRADLLSVFLASPADGERVVLVRGRLPLSPQTKFALPSIDVAGAASEGFRALVFRQPEVLVQVADSAGLKLLPENDFATALSDAQHEGLLEQTGDQPQGPGHSDTGKIAPGKLVAVLQSEQRFQAAQLQIDRNQPQLQALQVTTLDHSADAWRATVELNLHIESGVLDSLRFDLPANWIGPFEMTPQMPQLVEDVPGEGRRQLVLRPTAPLQHDVQLQIKGPLTIAAGQRPSAPDVRLQGVFRQTRYFSLPRRLENQQLAWDTRGLVPRSVPEVISATVPDPTAYRWYQLVGDRCRASLRSADRSSDNSQVRLVDVVWSWNVNGDFCGGAAFDLEPAGASSCELQLPPGEQLIQAQLDAAPAQLSPLGENHWNVWLGDNKLPRHLEVIFAGTIEKSPTTNLQLTAPTLVELPVERTLWSVWAPHDAGSAFLPTGTPIPALRHQQLRLEGAAALIDLATGLLLDESTDDVARWYTPWLRRFQALRADLIQTKSTATAGDEVQAAEAELNAVDQDQSRLARRLANPNPESQPATQSTAPSTATPVTVTPSAASAPSPATQPAATPLAVPLPTTIANQSATSTEPATATLPAVAAQPVVATDWLHLAALLQPADRRVIMAVVHGQGGPLAVDYPQFSVVGWQWRWIATACVMLVTIALLLAFRFGWGIRAHHAFGPQLLGLTAGLAWWFWLTPSLLGLAIIAVSLYFAWQNRLLQPV